MKKPYILVLGASVVDIFGFCGCTYKAYDSTPGHIKVSFGGVCRNIAENMARIGINTKLISVLGDDEKGYNIIQHSQKIGYDMEDSLILKGESTPTYMAVLDEHGEMISGIADMKSIDKMGLDFIDSKSDVIENAIYTIVDTDNPKNLEYILKSFSTKSKFILDPVSANKAQYIGHLLPYFHTIKPNRHEAEVLAGFEIKNDDDLQKAGHYFRSLGVEKVFISLDEEGIYYCDKNSSGKIKALDVLVKNVTGAGDSFVAGISYGYMNNLSMEDTVKFAMAMSIITISDENSINPNMTFEYAKHVQNSLTWECVTY